MSNSHNNSGEIEERIARIFHGHTKQTPEGSAVYSLLDKVIAGEDNRRDYNDLDNLIIPANQLRTLIDSTIILTQKENISKQPNNSYTLAVKPFQRGGLLPCSNERFANQNIGGHCSGFFVGGDVIVTAGHCVSTEKIARNTAFIFGFRVDDTYEQGTTQFLESQVYFGKDLIAHDYSETGDFAIVRVDRNINAPSAKALQVRSSGSIKIGSNIGVIGYPSGLPVKVAFGPNTIIMRDDHPWLLANLDTYGGNSGSAVFNIDGVVEGILVRGAQDYVNDYENSCFRSNRIMNSEGGEVLTKSSAFFAKIP